MNFHEYAYDLYLEQEVTQSLTNQLLSWALAGPVMCCGRARVRLRVTGQLGQSEAGTGLHWGLMSLRQRRELKEEEEEEEEAAEEEQRDGCCL